MEKPTYGWLVKWILAAILIVVGLTVLIKEELVYLITGTVIVIFSVFRIRALIKTLNTETQRTMNLIEIVLSTLIGVLLIFIGVKSLNGEIKPNSTWGLVYKYSLVAIFLMRSIVYFYSTVFLDEKSEQQKFWIHIALLILVGLISGNKEFDAKWVGWLLLIISGLGGLYLIYDGGGGYKKYREYQKMINEQKEKTKPKKEKKQPEDKKDEQTNDEVVIIEEEEEQPVVN